MPQDNVEATPPPCLIVIDEDNETLCGKEYYEEVLVRNQFALFAVSICEDHSRQHWAFYKKRNQRRRNRNGRERTRSASQPSGTRR